MNSHRMPDFVMAIVFLLGVMSCSTSFVSSTASSPLEETTFTPAELPSPTPVTTPDYLSHRIGVRVVDGVGGFYDRVTGEKFIPRGYNYVRLAPIDGTTGRLWEATLSPGLYDPILAEEALQDMEDSGYNVVRVNIDCCRTSNNVGDAYGRISPDYVDNVIDFLETAKAHGIYTLLVLHLTPADGPFNQLWNSDPRYFDGPNLRYLTPGGFEAKSAFDQAFISTLIRSKAPLDAIFAFDLTDDVVFDAGYPPLTLETGLLTTANGQKYNMAKPEEKIRMMRENLVYWIDQQREAILEIDPTALVTVSFPAYVANERPTFPEAAIWESTADFIDLHVYAGMGFDLQDYADQFGIRGMEEKPIIMGQFAALKQGFPNAASAAQALQGWQAASCQYGFDGWILWLRGSEEYTALYNGPSDGGVINDTLAPLNRPDPCQGSPSGAPSSPEVPSASESTAYTGQLTIQI